jgi:hypothetical protein
MTIETYVYQDGEVKLTGRTAVKTSKMTQLALYEITPANPDDGTWKRWVPFNVLYTIIAPKET